MLKEQKADLDVSRDVRAAARLVLRRRHNFENHVVVYLIVNLAIWLGVGLIWHSWYPWSLVPAAVWSIGLAFHAWFTFGPPNRPITEEAIDREVARLIARRDVPPEEPPPAWHETYWTATSDDARVARLDAGFDERPRDVTRLPSSGE